MDFSNNRTVLTRKGYDALQKELDEILTVKRPALAARLREAIQLGDLSENFDYQDAKRQQGMLEGRLKDLKAILASAHVVEASEGNGHVTVGSVVKVKDLDDGFEEEYSIVGPVEANPMEGKISHESSVGSALLDKRVGDAVDVQTPSGDVIRYEIISID